MATDSLVRYVGSSSVRSDIVRSVCKQSQSTDDLLATVGASESAVYDALSNLRARSVVTETDDGWQLTGAGRLVGDALAHQQATDRLLDAHSSYWEGHDTSVLPAQFRRRLPEIDECEVVERADHDLQGLVPWVVGKVESVESCDIISPIYHEEYENAMPDNEDSRLLVGQRVVDDLLLSSNDKNPRSYEETPRRVASIPFALGVSAEWIILSLPELDGTWPEAKLFSTTPSAIRWGRELFEHVWADATPIETYLAEQ